MRNDRLLLVGLIAIAGAAVLGLSFVDGISKQVLAPVATVIAAGLTGLMALRVEDTRRKADLKRAESEAALARAAEAKAMRERARQVAIPLRDQFEHVAASLRDGFWPEAREAAVSLTDERRDVLVSRLNEVWVLIAWGLRTMDEIAAKAASGASRRVSEGDVWLAKLQAGTLTMAAEALEKATWDEARVERDARETHELVELIMQKMEAQIAASEHPAT